jgi:hypothetical protein
LLLFLSDYSLPLSKLLIPVLYEKFELKERYFTLGPFFCGYPTSLLLKEGISDGILEVFVLCW